MQADFCTAGEKRGCTAEELQEAAQHGDLGEFWFLRDVKRDSPNCLEGFLFPDTYEFYTSDDPEPGSCGSCCGILATALTRIWKGT